MLFRSPALEPALGCELAVEVEAALLFEVPFVTSARAPRLRVAAAVEAAVELVDCVHEIEEGVGTEREGSELARRAMVTARCAATRSILGLVARARLDLLQAQNSAASETPTQALARHVYCHERDQAGWCEKKTNGRRGPGGGGWWGVTNLCAERLELAERCCLGLLRGVRFSRNENRVALGREVVLVPVRAASGRRLAGCSPGLRERGTRQCDARVPGQ